MVSSFLKGQLFRLLATLVLMGGLLLWVLVGCALLAVELNVLLAIDSPAATVGIAVACMFGGMVYAVAPFSVILLIRWQQVWRLKRVLGELGLEGRPLWHNGLQFRGTIATRYAEAFFYRGPTAEYFVEGPSHTRVNVVLDNPLARAVGGAGVVEDKPYLVYGEEAYARAWLADEEVEAALSRLVTPSASIAALFLRPDGCLVRFRGAGAFSVDPEAIRRLYADLTVLVVGAGAVTPETLIEPTAAEARRRPRWGVPPGCFFVLLVSPMILFGGLLPLILAISVVSA